jgi:hypothetical protein
MAKWCLDANLDAALANIANNADMLHVCSGQPADYAGIAAVELASIALTTGHGNGDYTIGDGDTSGRKLTVESQAIESASGSGTATHIALSNGSDTLYYVTTCTSQAITSGNPVNTPDWDIEIADPS